MTQSKYLPWMTKKCETWINWVRLWMLASYKSQVRTWKGALLSPSNSLLSTLSPASDLSVSGWIFPAISWAFRRKLDSCHYGVMLWQVPKITGCMHYWECRLLYRLSDHIDSAYFMDKENYRAHPISQNTFHRPSRLCTARHDFWDQQLT